MQWSWAQDKLIYFIWISAAIQSPGSAVVRLIHEAFDLYMLLQSVDGSCISCFGICLLGKCPSHASGRFTTVTVSCFSAKTRAHLPELSYYFENYFFFDLAQKSIIETAWPDCYPNMLEICSGSPGRNVGF